MKRFAGILLAWVSLMASGAFAQSCDMYCEQRGIACREACGPEDEARECRRACARQQEECLVVCLKPRAESHEAEGVLAQLQAVPARYHPAFNPARITAR